MWNEKNWQFRLLRVLSWLFTLTIALGALAAFTLYISINRYMDAPAAPMVDKTVLIEKGWGLNRIAQELERENIVNDSMMFRLGARLAGIDKDLRAGEYAITANSAPKDILKLLSEGDSLQHRVVIPEGRTVFEVFEILDTDPVLTGDLPLSLPAEGTLMPETYFVTRGMTRQQVLNRMQEDMRQAVEEAWSSRLPDLPIDNKEELVILASIIEKETAVADEYNLVSGVFVNRLNKGMLLQTDPTVVYALTAGKGPLGRRLLRKDLEIDHSYNTYRNPGLPPGPITNPGIGALKAAANPADTPYLYFVADGTGGHVFATNLDDHNKNVREWRKIRASQEQQ